MSYFFIINPNAGRRVHDVPARIREFFSGRRIRVETAYTEARGHASELAERAAQAGFATIVAAGGDGTIRETASPLIGKETVLGILPCGSGNGLARNLYIPLDFDQALQGLTEWDVRTVDAALADGKPFFCAAGVGLDAEVAHDFNSMSKRRGILPYVWHAARRVLSYRPSPATAVVDGMRLELTSMVNAVLNGVQYGGGAKVAPGAYIDDGLLDLVAIRKAPLYRLLAAVPDLFAGRLDRHTDFYSAFKGRQIDIDSGRACWYHIDGEDFYSDTGKIRFTVLPRALKVRAPKPSLTS